MYALSLHLILLWGPEHVCTKSMYIPQGYLVEDFMVYIMYIVQFNSTLSSEVRCLCLANGKKKKQQSMADGSADL
jgi:hypothetical protein